MRPLLKRELVWRPLLREVVLMMNQLPREAFPFLLTPPFLSPTLPLSNFLHSFLFSPRALSDGAAVQKWAINRKYNYFT
jgi:hypothetical protein